MILSSTEGIGAGGLISKPKPLVILMSPWWPKLTESGAALSDILTFGLCGDSEVDPGFFGAATAVPAYATQWQVSPRKSALHSPSHTPPHFPRPAAQRRGFTEFCSGTKVIYTDCFC